MKEEDERKESKQVTNEQREENHWQVELNKKKEEEIGDRNRIVLVEPRVRGLIGDEQLSVTTREREDDIFP